MSKVLGAWAFVAVLFFSGAALGQVYSGGDPEGFTLAPFTNVDPTLPAPTGMLWNGDLRACTSGPDYMLLAGYRYDGIWAVGGPYVMDNHVYEVPILTMWELSWESMFDEDDEITALAATPGRDAVYVAFQPIQPHATCLPILRVELDGTWAEAITCDELGAFEEGANRVRNLATAADGTLYAVVRYQDAGIEAVLRIDPAGPPGKRTDRILSGDTVLPPSPALDGPATFLQLAPLDQGRLAVLAQLSLAADNFTEVGWVLLRLDADGTITELTQRERTRDLAGVDRARHLPAVGCIEGMLFDATDRLLVCAGNGEVFLIDPDEPGRSHLTIPPTTVMNTLAAFTGKPVYASPGGAEGPGGCLGNIGFGDHRAYGTWMGTFMVFNWDEQLLDLDEDLAMGYEESAHGTHRFIADTDGGGTGDGLELIDYTDPLQGDDDRVHTEPAMRWVTPGLWFGSKAGNSTSSRHTIQRFGLAAPDGSLLLLKNDTGDQLVRFTGWDDPLVPTGQTGGQHMAMGPDGSVYRWTEDSGLLRSLPDGTEETVAPAEVLHGITGTDTVNVKGMAVQPDHTVVIGTGHGKLIAVDDHGNASVLYDAVADYAAAGLWTEETQCFGGMACTLSVGPVIYEPVHGMLMFWIETDLTGSFAFGFMLDLVALRPDQHLRVVADHWAFAENMSLLGGLEPLDMEPDMAGGVWVLGAGGGGRRLLHLDGRTLAPVTGITAAQPMLSEVTTAGGLALLQAWDLMVTTDGRIFAPDAQYSTKDSLVSFGLFELKPLVEGIRAGDLLVVDPEQASLSRLLPDGGGELLLQGAPFERPTAVAAASGLVAVGDSGLGEILTTHLDDDGRLGTWTTLAKVTAPTGMDIDDQGRILVVDGASHRLLRVALDGTVEELAGAALLGEPLDVVATASGAAAVTDAKGERLLRISPDKDVTTIADIPTPGAVALVAGRHYLVASSAGDVWPRTVDDSGMLGATGTEDTSWNPVGEPVGGLAADPDGTAYLAMVRTSNWDWQDPFPTLRAFRITQDGYVESMVRGGLLAGGGPADLCRVRGVGEPLPAEPSDKPLPMPVDEGTNEPESGGGGCSAAPGATTFPLGLFLALVGLLALLRRRAAAPRRHHRSWLALLVVLVFLPSCGDAGSGAPDSSTDDSWSPGEVTQECQGKELCQPAGPPVCVDGTAASKRCVRDDDNCWVWSSAQTCPAEAPCQDGVCGGLWCQPDCGLSNNCGDDGCGGTCGSCLAPDVCCDGHCGPCVADCSERECGWDGATGSCGTCQSGKVCVDGTCKDAGKAPCGKFLNECDARCRAWDSQCHDQCVGWLSNEGVYDLLNYEGCEFLYCAPCFEPNADQGCLGACIFSSCAETYATCFNRYGTATCSETWDCAEACDASDQPCIDACTATATREAMIAILGLVTCLEAICPPESPDSERQACESAARSAECAAQADACFGPCEPYCATWATCGPDQCTGLCGICPDNKICNGAECINP